MVAIASVVGCIVGPAWTVPATSLRDEAAGVLARTRRTFVLVEVVKFAEESNVSTTDRVEVVSRLSRRVSVALSIKVGIGSISVLEVSVLATLRDMETLKLTAWSISGPPEQLGTSASRLKRPGSGVRA